MFCHVNHRVIFTQIIITYSKIHNVCRSSLLESFSVDYINAINILFTIYTFTEKNLLEFSFIKGLKM